MKKVLITGATGNIGQTVIDALFELETTVDVYAAVRNIDQAKRKFAYQPDLQYTKFDFQNRDTFSTALKDVDYLFLLRPPQLADVKIFEPLLAACKAQNVKNIVFLSVQGAEKSKIIPHNKIERLVKEVGLNYIFIRPSYFMQNLTTTLYKEVKENKTITLPAGDAKFNWIDIEDIANTIAVVISNFSEYKNRALVLTGSENLSFTEVVNKINQFVDTPIQYVKTGPIRFFLKKKREKISTGFAIVQLVLHFLPRFQKEPEITTTVKTVLGRKPTTLSSFVKREVEMFRKSI